MSTLCQIHVHIQNLQFFFFLQINSGCLGLALQRSQLSGKFRQNIRHTNQVLLFFIQFLQRGSFSSLKFNDTGSLVKKFSSLFRLSTQDLIDLSLSDDGISFFTDTGVIEKFIDIFQTAAGSI